MLRGRRHPVGRVLRFHASPPLRSASSLSSITISSCAASRGSNDARSCLPAASSAANRARRSASASRLSCTIRSYSRWLTFDELLHLSCMHIFSDAHMVSLGDRKNYRCPTLDSLLFGGLAADLYAQRGRRVGKEGVDFGLRKGANGRAKVFAHPLCSIFRRQL